MSADNFAFTEMPVATLYTFSSSMWGSAAMLGVLEKNYDIGKDLVQKNVNLLHGENFSPEFLRINPKGTIPTLVVPLAHTLTEDRDTRFSALTDSVEVLEFLDRSRTSSTIPASSPNTRRAPALSPATIDAKIASDKIIKLIHEELAPDGNLLLLSARDEAELKFKSGGVPRQFLEGRQKALEKYMAEPIEHKSALNAFYKDRHDENSTLLSIYNGTATKEIQTAFFEKSKKAWASLPATLSQLAAAVTSHGGKFLLGEQFSLVDIHVGAWLARILAVAGVTGLSDNDPITKLHEVMGIMATEEDGWSTVVGRYWAGLASRDSFEKVYEEGLH